jgi:hypothetical protein
MPTRRADAGQISGAHSRWRTEFRDETGRLSIHYFLHEDVDPFVKASLRRSMAAFVTSAAGGP